MEEFTIDSFAIRNEVVLVSGRSMAMSDVQRRRMQRRLLKHHVPLFAAAATAVVLLYVTRSYSDVLSRASFATAYPATALLAATLIFGPVQILRRGPNPVSSDLRRDVGIWAGVLGIAHSVIGQMVHLRGRPWLYYLYEHRQRHTFPFRHDLFGFANDTGLAGALVVLMLLATSNDFSLRALGTPQWKRLQRWNYAAFLLIAAHALAYQVSERQHLPFIVLIGFGVGITALCQAEGYRSRRSKGGQVC